MRLRVATYLAPNMYPVYEAIASYIGRSLGIEAQLSVGTRFDAFAEGQVDVGFICGLPYVNLVDRARDHDHPPPIALLAAPVLDGARYLNLPVYFSDVVVRCDSPFETVDDLRGRSWAFNDPDSHSGYNVVRSELGNLHRFFGRVIEAGAHQKSLRMVEAGQVDASAIDSQVLSIEARDYPELIAQLRIIGSFGPSPIQPVVAATHLPEQLRGDLVDILTGIGDVPEMGEALDRGFVKRFVPVTDADYDPIRAMQRRAMLLDN